MKKPLILNKLYKTCFLTYVFLLALYVLAYNLLPHRSEVLFTTNQCYWFTDWLISFECGKDVLLGEVIEYALNFIFIIIIALVFPPIFWFISPIFLVFSLFFYFFVISYLFTKARDWARNKPSPQASERYCKLLKSTFIVLFFLSLPAQAYQSYNKHLVNSVFWKAKFDITNNAFNEQGSAVSGYSRAIWQAVHKNEPVIIERLFQKNYSKNSGLLQISLHLKDYKIAHFLLENGVIAKPKAIETIITKIVNYKSCNFPEHIDFIILDSLLEHSPIIDNKIIKGAAISLCAPLMKKLLDAGGDPNYTVQKNKTLEYWASVPEVKSNNTYNRWLHGEPKEKIEAHRQRMIDLITEYKKLSIEKVNSTSKDVK